MSQHPNPVGSEEFDDLADLRDYIERGYQGAIESDPIAYSGAARVAFADYIMARFMAYHKRQCRIAEQIGFLKGRLEENVRYFGEYRPLVETNWINTRPISIDRIRKEMQALENDIARLTKEEKEV